MLTITKVFTILCLLCCVGIGNTLVTFKQSSKLFFQMIAQVYSVPRQTEGRKKAFPEWSSVDLSSKLSLTCGGNVR